MRVSIGLVAALCIGAGTLGAQNGIARAPRPETFTLEQIMSAPFPSGVVPAPGTAGRIAWLSFDEGARSVWVAEPAAEGMRAVRVANFTSDDGQELSSLSLSRDGRVVAFVRGQGYNDLRENPNPSSDPEGAEQAVWVSRNGTPARRIGRGWSPAVSPGGQFVVYELDSTLMIAPSNGSAPPRPLFVGRGENQQAAWSPDGNLIAFSSDRDTHSYIGVFDRQADSIRWIAPSIDNDSRPRWSPDGTQLAFLRTGVAPGGTMVMIADPITGDARSLWRSEPGQRGQLRNPTAGESFLWAGRHLVFFMESDGWQHLYVLATDGSMQAPVQLTTGECEVEEPSPTTDGAMIYYSANCFDIDRKHIWRVATAGGRAPEQLTRGEGIEYAPAVSGTRLLYLGGDAHEPIVPVAASIAEATLQTVALRGTPAAPQDFPASALVEPRQVIFRADDGTQIHGQLFMPEDARGAPAVVFMHGGPSRQMLLGWHPRGYYNRAYALNQYLASRGYVVLSVNYRGGVGYGREFRTAPDRGRSGASEYQDVVAGGRFLQTLPEVDDARIGLWGGSYGGFLTAYGMVKNPELFKAGVDLHGVHDWSTRFGDARPEPGTREDSLRTMALASSPACCVDSLRGPILFIHGDDDRNVDYAETVDFVQMLRGAGKPYELIVYPDEVHDFLRFGNWMRTYHAAVDFFDRTLMRAQAVSDR